MMKNDGPRRSKLKMWTIVAGCVLVGLLFLYVTARVGFQFWIAAKLPDDAPRIAISLDDGLLNQLGITRSTYDQAMARAGGRLITIEPGDGGPRGVDAQVIAALFERENLDGLLLSGGGDVDPDLYGGDPDAAMLVDRARDDFEIALVKEARKRNLPILGICRGCQLLNVAQGGTLTNLREDDALKDHHFTFTGHSVTLEPASRLTEILGVSELENVYSFHGQAVGTPGDGVTVAALAMDGVVEAIEVDAADTESWIFAVQWHPEMTVADETQSRLFEAFVERARRARERRLRTER